MAPWSGLTVDEMALPDTTSWSAVGTRLAIARRMRAQGRIDAFDVGQARRAGKARGVAP